MLVSFVDTHPSSALVWFCLLGRLAYSRQRALLQRGAVFGSQLCHRHKNKQRDMIELGGGIWSLSAVSLLAVSGPAPFSKSAIWVMVGIQGGVVVIDFSVSAAHGSTLGPDGRAVSFCSFLLFNWGGWKTALLLSPSLRFSVDAIYLLSVISFLCRLFDSLLPGAISADKAFS